jgi:hypothetical protein
MRTTFDSYNVRAGRLDLEGVDFDDSKVRPLSPAALRSLRYMHDVEHHRVCYLRDLHLLQRAVTSLSNPLRAVATP